MEGFLKSHSVTWGGARRSLTEKQALSEVILKFLWPVFQLDDPRASEIKESVPEILPMKPEYIIL